MKIKAVVKEVKDNGYAVIEARRRSACAECHNDSCGACELFLGDDRISALAKNEIGAKVGDTVIAESGEWQIILSALAVFIFPLLFGFSGYAVGSFCFHRSEKTCALYALCAVAVYFIILFILTKLKKGVGQNITLTEIVSSNEAKM